MRKFALLLAMLLCLALPQTALAEAETEPAEVEAQTPVSLAEIDLSNASLEELLDLRERVSQRIDELKTDGPKCYGSGTYAVGLEIPVGVYLVLEEDHSIFPSVMVRQGASADSQLLYYEMLIHQAVIQLTPGTYLTLSDALAYPFDEAPEAGLVDGVGEEGGYWIGVQVPAGRYMIRPDDNAPLSSFSIYSGILGTNAQTLRFELIYEETEVILETGQYIMLSGCSLYEE